MKRSALLLAAALLLASSAAMSQDTATAQLTLTVNPSTVSITTATVPEGMVGLAYSTTIAASGGLAPLTFSVSSGSLPAGLSIGASTGVISGTPTASGSSTFTVKVTDSESPAASATKSYTLVVVPALVVTTSSLPAANIGVAYSATIAASGGVPPYTFAVTAGSLPAGVTLNPSTGALSGTPTASGSFTFTVTVTDSATNVVKLRIKADVLVAGAALAGGGRS